MAHSKRPKKEAQFFTFSDRDVSDLAPKKPQQPPELHPLQNEAKPLAESFEKEQKRLEGKRMQMIKDTEESEDVDPMADIVQEKVALGGILAKQIHVKLYMVAKFKLDFSDQDSLQKLSNHIADIDRLINKTVGRSEIDPVLGKRLNGWLGAWEAKMNESQDKDENERPSPRQDR